MRRICSPEARSRGSAGCFLNRPEASCSVRRSRQSWKPVADVMDVGVVGGVICFEQSREEGS